MNESRCPRAAGSEQKHSAEPSGEATRPCQKMSRRALLAASGVGVAGLSAAAVLLRRKRQRAAVFIARNQRNDGPLVNTIRDGLLAAGMEPARLSGKRVLLKPNMVEPTREAPHMTTHPSVIVAAAEVFRAWGAEVTVGEGPGHVRDTEMALVESGVQAALDDAGLPFADLNYEETGWQPNRGGASRLPGFHFPRSVLEADLVVSLPKLKTHHWIGMTAAMKNLYGVIPGIKYGWPKNVLHHAGIPQTVFDINASLPKTITVIDAIECMEGDGPILGTPRTMGMILVSASPVAADATAARLIGLKPERIRYLALAEDRLGPLDEKLISQRGESWRSLSQRFEILDEPHLMQLRA